MKILKFSEYEDVYLKIDEELALRVNELSY
jgi:hypothetical protein